MIKFTLKHPATGRKIFGIVLTDRNVELLQQDKPIHFHAEDLNLPLISFNEMIVLYYPNNEEAVRDLKEKGYIDERTVIEDIKITKM